MTPTQPSLSQFASTSPFAQLQSRLARTFQNGGHVWLIAILGICFFLYLPTFAFNRVFDDHQVLEENLHIRSWKYIHKAFTAQVLSGQKEGYAVTNSYRPFYLVWATFQYSLFGENPFGWHICCVGLYLIVIGLVWWSAGIMCGTGPPQIIATAIFAFHPIHVESVAWITCFADSLVLIGFIPAMVFYLRSVDSQAHHSRRDRWISAAFFLFALLNKEFAVFWIPMAFVYQLGMQSPGSIRDWLEKGIQVFRTLGVHLAVLIGYLAVRQLVLKENLVGNPDLTPLILVLTAPLVLLKYISLLIWPVNLRLEYELFYVGAAWSPYFWGPLATLGVLAVFVVWCGRRFQQVWIFSSWIILPLLPTLNLKHFRPNEFVHDRYLFLPSLGFACLVGWALSKLWVSYAEKQILPGVVTSGLILSLIVLSTIQVPFWASDLTLYTRILEFHPNNAFALNNLSIVLRANQMVAEEIIVLERLSRVTPGEVPVYYSLANTYFLSQNHQETIKVLTKVKKLDPNFQKSAQRCFQLGYSLLMTKQLGEAEVWVKQAITQNPNHGQYWYTLGDIQLESNHRVEAIQSFQKATELNPQFEPIIKQRLSVGETQAGQTD